MSTIDEAVEVHVPVRSAYDQWTHFESFPRFMEGVEEVRQLDSTHLHWKASVGGVTREWTAEITDQVPDECIAWRSVEGHPIAGEVTFEKLGLDTTRVRLHIEHEPETTTEAVGDWLGMARHRARQDLERFRDLMEDHVDTPHTREDVTEGPTPETRHAHLREDITEGPTPETRGAMHESDDHLADDDMDDGDADSFGAAI